MKNNKKITKALSVFMAASMLLAGCGADTQNEDTPTLTWYVNTLLTGNGKEAVFTKANELLKERYNLQLEVVGIDSGNYDQKMQVMNAGRDVYDLAFTSHWKNDYFSGVANGVYYELTEEELKKYAPKTYESMSDEIWNAVKVDGKIYAVPNWQIQTRATGINIPTEFIELTGADINNIKTIDDITEYLRAIIAKKPECNKIPGFWTQLLPYYGMVEVYEEGMPGVIYFTKEGKPQIFNQYDSQEFLDYVALRHQWIDEGLCVDKYLPDSKASTKEKKEQPFMIHVYKPGVEGELTKSKGYDWSSAQMSQPVIATSGVTAALTGVSATSKNPQAALRMIEVLNTDSEIHNLLSYGIEGVDYEKTSEKQIKKLDNKQYSGINNWTMGTVANTYMLDTQEPTVWEDTKKFNDEAVTSPLLGFNADITNLTLEIANCKTVINEYLGMIDLGLYDDAKVEEFRSKLKQAGAEKIMTEIQSQIDEWWETNNK